MSNDIEIRAASILNQASNYIDVKRFAQRIEGINKAYIDFITKEIEDNKDAPPNAELPLLLAMGMTLTNGIAMTAAYSGADEEFYKKIKESVLSEISQDMDNHYNIGIEKKSE